MSVPGLGEPAGGVSCLLRVRVAVKRRRGEGMRRGCGGGGGRGGGPGGTLQRFLGQWPVRTCAYAGGSAVASWYGVTRSRSPSQCEPFVTTTDLHEDEQHTTHAKPRTAGHFSCFRYLDVIHCPGAYPGTGPAPAPTRLYDGALCRRYEPGK